MVSLGNHLGTYKDVDFPFSHIVQDCHVILPFHSGVAIKTRDHGIWK